MDTNTTSTPGANQLGIYATAPLGRIHAISPPLPGTDGVGLVTTSMLGPAERVRTDTQQASAHTRGVYHGRTSGQTEFICRGRTQRHSEDAIGRVVDKQRQR